MLNNRDDSQEDSEYHFSDEEVSYDSDSEFAKPAGSVAPKQNILSQMTQSKRMLVVLGVFVVLIFVVFKIISPSSSTPTTDITDTPAPMPTVSQVTPAAPMTPPAVVNVAPSSQAMQQPPQNIQPAQTLPNNQMAPPLTNQVPAQPQMTTPVASQPTNMQAQPSPMPQGQMPSTSQMPEVVVQSQQAVTQMATTAASQLQQQYSPQQTAQMNAPTSVPVQVMQGQPQQGVVPGYAAADSRLVSLTAENEKLMGQLQAEYAQKLNDYQTQNKSLQEQVQSLNSKVAGMESQMNQLAKSATQQVQASESSSESAAEPKIAFTVQAIIPGRAWLRSDNGETITVSEGDTIKDVGKVIKIDPYDGVVQVNVGNKTVSLTYGNNG